MKYDEGEQVTDYWTNITLAEFWSKYDVVYHKEPTMTGNIIKLKNEGFIRRRLQKAVLRYHLKCGKDEDLARGLLILFKPFRHEMSEIHNPDVKLLLAVNRDLIETKRHQSEKYKLMTQLISEIQADVDKDQNDNSDETDENVETTSSRDIEDFSSWAIS